MEEHALGSEVGGQSLSGSRGAATSERKRSEQRQRQWPAVAEAEAAQRERLRAAGLHYQRLLMSEELSWPWPEEEDIIPSFTRSLGISQFNHHGRAQISLS